jgi:hypothetical protein
MRGTTIGFLGLTALACGGLGPAAAPTPPPSFAAPAAAPVATPATAPTGSTAWDGKFPISCYGGELVVRGAHADVPDNPAIWAGGDCRIRIEDCTISAPEVLYIGGNAEATIVGGRFTGSAYSIDAAGYAKVTVTGTELIGPVSKAGYAEMTISGTGSSGSSGSSATTSTTSTSPSTSTRRPHAGNGRPRHGAAASDDDDCNARYEACLADDPNNPDCEDIYRGCHDE